MAAPRIRLKESDRRCALASLDRTSEPLLLLDDDPPNVRRANSAAVPRANPAPREANPNALDIRVDGTALPSGRCFFSSSSS